MKKSILWLVSVLFLLPLAITSCEEDTGLVNPYGDWKNRNQQYIDSIAKVARENPSEWKVIHTYQFLEPTDPLAPKEVNDYVYCKVLENGSGTMKPLFTDAVSTHYRGRLIPLYDGSKVVFDQSYMGELNPETAVSVEFGVSGVIEGWTTALQQMVEGDRWEVYIPYNLAYGAYGQSSIPGYSTLIFDMQLVKISTNR